MSDYPKSDREKDEERYFEVYKLMIHARDFHHDSHTKWMNFFYVAEAAVLFAYINYTHSDHARLMLSLLGFAFSLLAYLSCKGFYFWTYNWTDQVYRLEKHFIKELRVYSIFSENTEDDDSSIVQPLKPANLSTSKLTILFFLLIYFVWTILLARNFLIVKDAKADVWGTNFLTHCGLLTCLFLAISLLAVYLCRPWLKSNWFIMDEKERKIVCRDKKDKQGWYEVSYPI